MTVKKTRPNSLDEIGEHKLILPVLHIVGEFGLEDAKTGKRIFCPGIFVKDISGITYGIPFPDLEAAKDIVTRLMDEISKFEAKARERN